LFLIDTARHKSRRRLSRSALLVSTRTNGGHHLSITAKMLRSAVRNISFLRVPQSTRAVITASRSPWHSRANQRRFSSHDDSRPEKDGLTTIVSQNLVRVGVFAATGLSSMYVVRPVTENVFGVQGSIRDGPWSYRLACVFFFTPCYACILVGIGTAVGQQAYFKRIAYKAVNRFNPFSSENLYSRIRAYVRGRKY